MNWAFLSFALFGVVAVVLLVLVPRLWNMDVDTLERRTSPVLRRSVAASPALLVWCWMTTVLGVLLVIDGHGVRLPSALRLALGALWFGLTLICIGAAYYGRPRRALLPALRADESYARFMRPPSA